jgi:hypothetical protein
LVQRSRKAPVAALAAVPVVPVEPAAEPVLEPAPAEPVQGAAELVPAQAELVPAQAELVQGAAVSHTSNVAARVPPVRLACATSQLRLQMELCLGANGLPVAQG